MQLLAEVPGQVIEREQIYQKVWGYAMAHGDRSVDVFVRKLRQKLQRHSPNWRYIHTHFGIGYRFDPEPVGGFGEDSVEAPAEAAAETESAPAELATEPH
jgi:DNA-binding winged helix-turn-helix (wHTH) protein